MPKANMVSATCPRLSPFGGKERGRAERAPGGLCGALRRKRFDSRAGEDVPIQLETRAVAGTIPGAVDLVPADDAAHVSAGRRDCVHPSVLVFEGGDLLTLDLEDGSLAAPEGVEYLRLLPEVTAKETGSDAGVLGNEFRAAGDRFDPPRIENLDEAVLLSCGEIGQHQARGRSIAETPGAEACRDQISISA